MRTPTLSHIGDNDLSSPDPLATSIGSNPSVKRIPKSSPIRRHTKNRSSSSNMSILPPSSPSRTITEQTISPWKIRVTVEAEPEGYNSAIQTNTRTVKIPLREEGSSTVEVKKKAGRSRAHSKTSTISNPRQRSVTPTRERKRRESVTNLDVVVLGDDADEDEWSDKTRKASPRKSKSKKNNVSGEYYAVKSDVAVFEAQQDIDIDDGGALPLDHESPELRQIDLNKVSVRGYTNPARQKSILPNDFRNTVESKHQSKPLPATSSMARRTVSANSAMTYPTPSPTASERGRSVEVEEQERKHMDGFDTIMESEGFTMIDLDTIPSVKHMLSSPPVIEVETSSSQSKSPTGSETSVRRNPPSQPAQFGLSQLQLRNALPPDIMLPEGESDISSTVPSSPPAFQTSLPVSRQRSPLTHLQVPSLPKNRQVTPQPYSSPKLPSPPRQPNSKDRSSPDSAKAVKAALALQYAVEPIGLQIAMPMQTQNTSKDITHSRSSSEELFDGFDSGTKRELRAGLRFGEELAKRQASNTIHTSNNYQNRIRHQNLWRGESVIQRTPVQTQSGQSPQVTDSEQQSDTALESATRSTQTNNIGSLQDTATRREHEWQLEREAVSKQIADASPSKVIVIDSDEESGQSSPKEQIHYPSIQDVSMDDDEDDIWLEEAKDSSSSPHQDLKDPAPLTDHVHHQEKSENQHVKSRRGLIPDSWKRGEKLDVGNNSTIITNGDEPSGLLWKQAGDDSNFQFGAAAIHNVRNEFRKSGAAILNTRKGSGSFDINKMLGTPKRIAESLDKQVDKHDSSNDGHRRHDMNDLETENLNEDEEYDDETSLESIRSNETETNAQPQQLVAVNFNDSISTESQSPPARETQTRSTLSPPTARPPTPRSAMKGTRQSLGATTGAGFDGEDQASRRVIFAQRSKGVNVDWVESSSSLNLSPDDMSSPIVEHQKHQHDRQLVLSSSIEAEIESPTQQTPAEEELQVDDEVDTQEPKGWFGWLWKGKQPPAAEDNYSPEQARQVDGTSDASHERVKTHNDDNQWASTSTQPTLPSTTAQKSQPHPQQHTKSQIPSYLLAPSYPSDPKRNTKSPLPTSGPFTNTHFRTLHIIHRKAQRPRFHAPNLSSCRPDIRDLVYQKWKLEVDESDAGLGGFAWTVGEMEARVLERFCREVEFGFACRRCRSDEEIGDLVGEWLGTDGIWGGNAGHGTGRVEWGWSVADLATRLGRIVIGEVVREEEFGGRKCQG